MLNPPVSAERFPTLDDAPWQPVSSRYATLLRIQLFCYGLPLTVLSWWVPFTGGDRPVNALVAGILALAFTALILLWAPRRARHTRYFLRRLDMHVQTGLLWRKTLSVAINRVQHMEVTQGPLERGLGLSRLVLYTAGGMKSDLVVPGLATDAARELKTAILELAGQADRAEASDAGE